MWVLDVIAGTSDGADMAFYLVAGEWTVGRKRCHLSFLGDSSISRTHALIRVGALTSDQLGDPSTRPALELVDTTSRFGSFVNEEKCIGTRRLQPGDEISFGAKKTVLRVRYQVIVLVASRIQRSSRVQVNDACQCTGMHVIAAPSKDATHCIMDQGHIVATVKVLWALVYNQPVVCTQWLYAILNRSRLSDPLPRCEDYLPANPSLPSVERNYLPDPLRKTLFRGYAVVFLTPQSMQELIPAMDGVVVTAYKEVDGDDRMLREMDSLTSSKQILLIEPLQVAGSSCTAGQSEQQASAFDNPPCSIDVVERRVKLFAAMGAVFTSVQELAACVIFVKSPTSLNGTAFNHNLASYSKTSIQRRSSPERLSVQSTSTVDHKNKKDETKQEEKDKEFDHDATMEENYKQLSSPHYEGAEIKGRNVSTDSNINVMQLLKRELRGQGIVLRGLNDEQELMLTTVFLVLVLICYVTNEGTLSPSKRMREMTPSKSRAVDLSAWKSLRLLRQHDMKPKQHDNSGEPVVMSCELVVKKRESFQQSMEGGNGLVNYKRFKKQEGCGSRASLFPQQTVVSVVNNADRVALQGNLDIMEEQERIAEELFAVGEGRAKTKLFQAS
uniref:FHA domain-containing protein n=1 Tax=Peronospora matthiolae TaxID=2874970 RepID=A0AAV1VLD7_9STRA